MYPFGTSRANLYCEDTALDAQNPWLRDGRLADEKRLASGAVASPGWATSTARCAEGAAGSPPAAGLREATGSRARSAPSASDCAPCRTGSSRCHGAIAVDLDVLPGVERVNRWAIDASVASSDASAYTRPLRVGSFG